MKLKEWLDKNEISYHRFADLVPIAPGTLWNIFWKGCFELKTALKIEQLTLGAVTCEELVEPEIAGGVRGKRLAKESVKAVDSSKKSTKRDRINGRFK